MGKKRTNIFPYVVSQRKKKHRRNNENTISQTSNTEFVNNQNEISNTGTTNFTRYSLKRISNICNMQKETLSNSLYLDLGDCTYICKYCGAFFWFNERANETKPLKFNLCCKNGKIQLPLLKETPHVLDNLLDYYGGLESTYYRKNIRTINSMLAFTSFGANIDSSASDFHGPHIFKINGQIHHLLGSLLPVDNNPNK